MTEIARPALVGFEKSDSVSALLSDIGLVPGLGDFLSEHLLEVLRRQHGQLNIESIEFIGSGNCNAGGMQSETPNIVHLHSISVSCDVDVVVTVGNERYSLNLQVVLHANLPQAALTSDVLIKNQTFLGKVFT